MRTITLAIGAAVAVAACSVAHAGTPVQLELMMQEQTCTQLIQRYEAGFQARDHGMPLDQALLASKADPVFQSFIKMIYNRRDIKRVPFEREEFNRCMLSPDY